MMNKLTSKKQFKILIAEDNTMFQLIIAELLKNKGIFYELAQNGLEAVELARTNSYDLIIMDIEMPVLNGVDATKQIRAFNPSIPIIAFTALNTNSELLASCLHVMDEYIPKSSDTISLSNILNKYNAKIA